MWVCSVKKSDSKPRSSTRRAIVAGSGVSSVGKIAIPKRMRARRHPRKSRPTPPRHSRQGKAVGAPCDRFRAGSRTAEEMSGTSRAATAAPLSALAALALTSAPAAADEIPSALGIPCTPGPDGVQRCEGSIETRVPSWDGVPLDVDLTFPPAAQPGPHPLIVSLHGWGQDKSQVAVDIDDLARQGYAVMAYSARGFGDSCGSEASREAPGCARGWIHLADARFEARDTQHLAELLVDEGLVEPRIGVTGVSYGGGQSLMLATLKDRVMRPNGKLTPWRSPGGTPMRIAAAAPRIGWSDLSYSLVPNGGTLDFRSRNPYRPPFGVAKQSYLAGLFATGAATGYYAPPGADPDADLTGQFEL